MMRGVPPVFPLGGRRQETGYIQETGDIQEAGDRLQDTGYIQEAGDRRRFQNVSFTVKNVHPRPDESGHPRRHGTKKPGNGGQNRGQKIISDVRT